MRCLRAACALGFASLALVTAWPSRAEPGDPMLAGAGAQMFQEYCAACHGTSGEGNGPAAPALKKAPADLTRIAARRGGNFPDAEIARFIDGRFDVVAHGTREMPIWGSRFGDAVANGADTDEVARGRLMALVEYLKTIQTK